MSTFAELILEYTTRIGISDAELARKIGVRRQTIFRWKEGLVQRPRDRQVVLDLGKALRLTPEEQDGLLLAAGFAPETLPTPPKQDLPDRVVGSADEPSADIPSVSTPPDDSTFDATLPPSEMPGEPATGATTRPKLPQAEDGSEGNPSAVAGIPPTPAAEEPPSVPESAQVKEVQTAQTQRRKPLPYIIGGVLLVGLLAWGFNALTRTEPTAPLAMATTAPLDQGVFTATPEGEATTAATVAAVVAAANEATPIAATDPLSVCQAEAEDETLLLVARFVPYGTQRFNVAGRILEALEEETNEEMSDPGLTIDSLRLGLYGEQITSKQEAEALIANCPAAVLVWGEYDDGRVLAQVTSIRDNRIQFPADRVTQFNVNIPAAVRILALEALGAVLRTKNRYSDAASSFQRALVPLPDTPEIPDDGQKYNLYFYLGHALYVRSTQNAAAGNIEEALADYAKAIDSYSNADVLAQALDKQDPALSYNHGIAYLGRYQTTLTDERDLDDIESALANLTQSLRVRRDYAQAYLMRGNTYMQRQEDGDRESAIQDYSAAIRLADESEPPDYLKRAFYNRALAQIQSGADEWEPDLDQALTYGYPARDVFVAKCYGFLRETQVDNAKNACETALDAGNDEPDLAYLNYAIALAVLSEEDAQGSLREESIMRLEAHIEWLHLVNGRYDRYQGELADAWLAELEAGGQPFDEETLRNLE